MAQRNFKLEQAIELVENLDLSVEDNRLIKYYIDYLKQEISNYKIKYSEANLCIQELIGMIPITK